MWGQPPSAVRLGEAREHSMSAPRTPDDRRDRQSGDENSSQKRNFWLQYARYGQLAFVLPAALVVGWLIGAALDRWLHTTWLYLVGILLGIAAGFIELIRTAMRDTK
jgi:ATP synthase protein I